MPAIATPYSSVPTKCSLQQATTTTTTNNNSNMALIPFPYIAFFLWIEPVATLVGAYFAWFQSDTYLQLQHAASSPSPLAVPTGTAVVLRQLGNMYFVFAFNEAFVLRATNDLKVWRAFLLGLLIADFGHLYSCYPLGLQSYYDFANWNAIDYGNYPFVVVGASMRILFLTGCGIGSRKRSSRKPKTPVKGSKLSHLDKSR